MYQVIFLITENEFIIAYTTIEQIRIIYFLFLKIKINYNFLQYHFIRQFIPSHFSIK